MAIDIFAVYRYALELSELAWSLVVMDSNESGPEQFVAPFRWQFGAKLASLIQAPPHIFLESGGATAYHQKPLGRADRLRQLLFIFVSRLKPDMVDKGNQV